MMARFCAYLDKVFHFSRHLASLPEPRQKPQIPISAIFLSALLMAATRLGSLNALEGELRLRGRWEKLVGRRKPSADRVGQVVGLLDPDWLRELLAWIEHRLRRNKALDDNPWALRIVALDAHEFFSQ